MIDSHVSIPGPVGGLQDVPGGVLKEACRRRSLVESWRRPGGVLEEAWWSPGGGLQEAPLVWVIINETKLFMTRPLKL